MNRFEVKFFGASLMILCLSACGVGLDTFFGVDGPGIQMVAGGDYQPVNLENLE
jgi:hypothetical protein